MRVITGSAKGRKLKSPPGMTTRPTTDRVKEALFNILGHNVVNSDFLDLFAGTGAIGIEALSRGANSAVFIEKDPRSFQILTENIKLTGFTDQAQTYRQDVLRALELIVEKGKKFNIVFADPPYLNNFETKILNFIDQNNILQTNGIIIIERSKKDILPDKVGKLSLFREEKYGDTVLSFYDLNN